MIIFGILIALGGIVGAISPKAVAKEGEAPPKRKDLYSASLFGLGLIVVGNWLLPAPDHKPESSNTRPPSAESAAPNARAPEQSASKAPECDETDLQCLGDKGSVAAGVYCKRPVEMLAQYSVRWTDGMLDLKFDRFRWKDKDAGIITYIGDKAEFQNGFGAYMPVIYECDLDKSNKTVLDVRIREGRLPS